MSSVLVLGLGNILLGDDGLGVAAVGALEARYTVPQSVRVVDGGTLGLALLDELAGAENAILVDAILTGAPPGTPVRLEGDAVAPAVEARLSPHQVGVADLLAAAELTGVLPRRLVLLGLVPGSLELQVGCSPHVRAALPDLVDRVAGECARLGHPLLPRPAAEARP